MTMLFDAYESAAHTLHENRDEDWIKEGLRSGKLSAEDYVRRHGEGRWRHLGNVSRFAHIVPEPGSLFGKMSARPATLDLTPLVDVSFLLLLFFMLTATYTIQKTIEIPKPESENQSTALALPKLNELRQDNIIVSIEPDNTILVDDEITSRDSLVPALRAKVRRAGKTELIIKADDEALHDNVVAVIDAANEVGMQHIRIATVAQTAM